MRTRRGHISQAAAPFRVWEESGYDHGRVRDRVANAAPTGDWELSDELAPYGPGPVGSKVARPGGGTEAKVGD